MRKKTKTGAALQIVEEGGQKFRQWRLVRVPLPLPAYPFREMLRGESFFEEDITRWGTLRARAYQMKKWYEENGETRTWAVRREGKGVRVYRTE